MLKKVLILGGYGNFGRLICENLSEREDIQLIISGRRENRASELCRILTSNGAKCALIPAALDIYSGNFHHTLSDIKPDMVIHTSGPFQGQDYHVPKACIGIGSHYIDLADDRRFVCDFHTLDASAKERGVIAISGASSVPGLSSVVIDRFAREFERLDEIDFGIVPGSNVDLGEATVRGILSYTGHPFKSWQQNKSMDIHGWMNIRRENLGAALGKRWLANVDIPDLELFPDRYQGVKTVRFQAGHELTIVHLALASMALLAKLKLIRHWDSYTTPIYRLGRLLKGFGSDTGGMFINLTGMDNDNRNKIIKWRLIAGKGVGPYIPTIPAVILANKILNKELTQPIATPCLGMYSLEEFSGAADKWGIYQQLERM